MHVLLDKENYISIDKTLLKMELIFTFH